MSETKSLHEQALECAAVATAETWSIHSGLDSVEVERLARVLKARETSYHLTKRAG